MSSYTQLCRDFIRLNGYITHRDILNITDTNCSYSIMRLLKKTFDFEEKIVKTPTSQYTMYTVKEQE